MVVGIHPGVEGSWMIINVELAEIGVGVRYLVVGVHLEVEGSWSWTINMKLVEIGIEVGCGHLGIY